MSYRPKNTQERILHRLKIARGHLNKIISMIEEDAYCIDVLHQSEAVAKALEETDALILENHLNTCVVDHIKQGDTKKSIEEIMNVFRRKKR
jgi:DNA-binding FrmR family transcriptional regulator